MFVANDFIWWQTFEISPFMKEYLWYIGRRSVYFISTIMRIKVCLCVLSLGINSKFALLCIAWSNKIKTGKSGQAARKNIQKANTICESDTPYWWSCCCLCQKIQRDLPKWRSQSRYNIQEYGWWVKAVVASNCEPERNKINRTNQVKRAQCQFDKLIYHEFPSKMKTVVTP